MNNLDSLTEQTIKNIEGYEKRWHIFKAFLYLLVGLSIILVNVYTFHRLYQNSDSNRQLLRCTDVTLTIQQTPQSFKNQLQNCLNNTK